jgi:hypothetical protein
LIAESNFGIATLKRFSLAWLSAYPFSGVTRGLDPRVHPFRNKFAAKKMDCRVEPGNDGGETAAAILRPFEPEPL